MATKGLNDSQDSRKRMSQDNSNYNSPSELGEGKNKESEKEKIVREINKARRYLADGHTQKAIERANEAMKAVNKLFGNSAELLPCYFVLAEAFIEEGKNKKAEDYLIQAYWSIVKHDKDNKQPGEEDQNQAQMSEEDRAINKATLHKVFARLYTAKDQTDKAMDHITEGIYLDTKRFGPEDINVSLSYYTIANIFAKQGKIIEAQIYYAKAVELWYRFLKNFFKSEGQIEEPDEILYKQASSMLKNIEMSYLNYQREGKEIQEEALIELNYTMSMLYRLMNDDGLSMEYAKTLAKLMYDKYGELHKKYLSMQRLLPYNFAYDQDFQKPQQGYLMQNDDRFNDSHHHPVFDDNSMVQPNNKYQNEHEQYSVDHDSPARGHHEEHHHHHHEEHHENHSRHHEEYKANQEEEAPRENEIAEGQAERSGEHAEGHSVHVSEGKGGQGEVEQEQVNNEGEDLGQENGIQGGEEGQGEYIPMAEGEEQVEGQGEDGIQGEGEGEAQEEAQVEGEGGDQPADGEANGENEGEAAQE